MSVVWGKTRVQVLKGDITDQDVDAVVNAANSNLTGGGGVDGAIHAKGGPRIHEECMQIRKREWPEGLPSGEAVVTTGGRLKARHVIHEVGPVWRGGSRNEPVTLASCYRNSLRVAERHGLGSVAFPSISTGAYGYPIGQASRVALEAVKRYLEKGGTLVEVVFVLFSESDFEVYLQALRELG